MQYMTADLRPAPEVAYPVVGTSPPTTPTPDPRVDRAAAAIGPLLKALGEQRELSIPAGRFDCLRYTREESDSAWRFWFARDLPGQPIRFEHQVGDAVVFSATLLENVPGGSRGAGA